MARRRQQDRPPAKGPKDVKAHIAKWKPEGTIPEKHQAFITRTTRKANPQTIAEARATLAVFLDYVEFLGANGFKIHPNTDPIRVFDDNKLQAWERDLRSRRDADTLTEGTLNTYLSRMTVALENLSRSVVHGRFLMGQGGTRNTGAITPPTPDADIARWLRVADAQPDDRGARLKAVVLAVRGAGLGISDLRHLRGADAGRRRDGTVIIRVKGDCPRNTVVLDRFGGLVLSTFSHFGEYLVLGEWADSRNVSGDLIASIEGGAGLDRKQLVRALRRAYVVEMLQTNTNPIVLQQQLGGLSLSEIENAIPFIDPTHLDRSALRAGAADRTEEAS